MEGIFKSLIAAGGASASFLWGGWSSMLAVLLTFVAIDYVTGILAAGVEG